MKHVMVDIETLGMPPKGALLQIGACMFDPYRAQDTEELVVDSFLVSVRRGYYEGMRDDTWAVEPRTVEWWGEQSEAAQEGLMLNLVSSPREALVRFTEWLTASNFVREAKNSQTVAQVWANPPTFDLAILNYAFDACDLQRPWHYRQEKDARTLMWLGQNIPNMRQGFAALLNGLVPHRGDHDAIRQALYVQRALARIARLNGGLTVFDHARSS